MENLVEIGVSCYSNFGRSSASKTGTIEISASDLKAQTTVDEIAFIIAHELSHLLLAHDEALIGIAQGLVVIGLDDRTTDLEAPRRF